MAEAIVLASLVLAVAFSVAWARRPDLRAWIERPKYTLDRNLRAFDASMRQATPSRTIRATGAPVSTPSRTIRATGAPVEEGRRP